MKQMLMHTRVLARGRSVRVLTMVAGFLAGSSLVACKDLTGNDQLPAGTPNPAIYNSASGAVGLRNAAIYGLGVTLPDYVRESGLLTDELEDNESGASAGVLLEGGGVVDPIDERILPYGTAITGDVAYGELQKFRGTASLAMHALATYDTAPADTAQQHLWNAELHAYVGYVEILLADLYCSGVPLSTLNFQGDFTYQPGSSTVQLYHAALAEEDSALALGQGSDSVMHLIRGLQGRAYLALGQYTIAKDDVSAIPTAFQYTVNFQIDGYGEDNWLNSRGTIGNVEGGNGLPYRTSGDPRSAALVVCAPTGSGFLYPSQDCPVDTLTFPKKYQASLQNGTTMPFPVVSGVEARLIEAEADLQAGTGSTWLTVLNTLRATVPIPSGGGVVPPDTLWDTLGVTGCGPDADHDCDADGVSGGYFQVPAGYALASAIPIQPVPSALVNDCSSNSSYEPCYDGIVDTINVYVNPGQPSLLTPLADPGTAQGRVALLFQERAYWLFLTGHREGDLRRLLRQYGPLPQYPAFASQQQVYPSGVYTAPGTGLYGEDVNLPVPPTEISNPDFHGCLDRNP